MAVLSGEPGPSHFSGFFHFLAILTASIAPVASGSIVTLMGRPANRG